MTKLENRYIVFKISDLNKFLRLTEEDDIYYYQKLVNEMRKARKKNILNGIFIEEDWPEYEVVKKLLEDRIALKSSHES